MKGLAAGVLGLAAALWAAGCQETGEEGGAARDVQEQTPYEQQYTTADTSEGYRGEGPVPVTPVQGAEGSSVTTATEQGALTATGQLVAAAGGGAAGSVILTEAGAGGTQVRISMTGAASGSRLQASLVQGSCRQPGAVVARVGQAFAVEQTGIGTLVASVPQPTRAFLDGRHAVRVEGQGATVACADLPALDTPR